ncbi:MAG: hypothetical protein ACRD8W_13110, partial [Nitrososphaeraceae archaeon]
FKTNSLSVTVWCMHIYIARLNSMRDSPEWPAYCPDSDPIALSRDLSVMDSAENSRSKKIEVVRLTMKFRYCNVHI